MKLRLISALAALLMSAASALAANVPLIPSAATISATANASWATSASTITLSNICPVGILPNVAVYDTSLAGNPLIGYVGGCTGNTLQLQANALSASSGSADVLRIAGPGPAFEEPSQTLAAIGYQTSLVNAYAPGNFLVLPAPVTTSGTSANTILTSPGGALLPFPGQAIRVTAWGVNSADANAKTITLNFGASGTMSFAVTGSGQSWLVNAWIQNVGTLASPKWQAQGWALTAATVVTVGTANGTDALATTGQNINLTATAATAGTITVNGAVFEYLR